MEREKSEIDLDRLTHMSITIQQDGRRLYLIGHTYPVKDQIRNGGGKWDPDRKAWYVGVARRQLAEQIVATCTAAPAQAQESLAEDAREIAGRATYHGRSCYVLGRVIRGRTQWDDEVAIIRSKLGKLKLASRDGARIWWAPESEVRIDRQYPRLTSIASLREYAAAAQEREARNGCGCSCHEADYCQCGRGFCHYHHDGCDRCGCEG